mgnify:FL=1
MGWDFIPDGKALYQYVLGRIRDSPGKPCLFIDEVQEISNWERAVNSLLAVDRTDIIGTGSNAELLSSELATVISAGNSPEEFRRYPLRWAPGN